MTKNKSTKRALLSSVLSLLLCMTMLIGTTFAWFTDNASTGVNTIQSGKLDIVLEMKDAAGNWVDAEGKTIDFIKADNSDTILWEPGCTYQLPAIRVRNNGNLALKYELVINGVDGDAKLLEAIDFTANGAALKTFTGELLPEDEGSYVSEEIVIQGHMREEAGNEYQDKKIEGISISVFATQLAHEYDSFDNQYDKDAIYYDTLVSSADELYNAVEAASGDVVIAVDGNIALTKALSKKGLNSIKFVALNEDSTIDQATYHMHFNGAKVTFEGLTLTHGEKPYGDGGQAATSFVVFNATEVNYIDCTFNRSVGTLHASVHNFIGCTFNGVENPDNTLSEYPLYNYDSDVTNVIDCVFNSTNKGAILFYGDNTSGNETLNISGTSFLGNIIDDKTAVEIHSRGCNYTVNIEDVIVADTVINGLYRIKPASVAGKVTVNVDGDTVIEYATLISTPAELANIANGGNYVLTNDIDMKDVAWTPLVTKANNGAITIEGNGYAIKNLTASGDKAGLIGYSAATTTIKNLTISNATLKGTNTDGENAAGALIAWAVEGYPITIEGCTIDNCNISDAKYIGGIVGYKGAHASLTITNSTIKNSILTTTYNEDGEYKGHMGGVIGFLNDTDAEVEISGCTVAGTEFVNENSSPRVGIFGGTNHGVIENCQYSDIAGTENLQGSASAGTVNN